MPGDAVVVPVVVHGQAGLHGHETGVDEVLGVIGLAHGLSCNDLKNIHY